MFNRLLDKLLLFVCCLAIYFISSVSVQVVPIIVVLAISAFNSYIEQRLFLRVSEAAVYALSLCFPEYIFFLPLMSYDLLLFENPWIIALAILPIVVQFSQLTVAGSLLIIVFLSVAALMHWRTSTLLQMQHEYSSLRDNTKELLLSLEAKNRELMEKQDYEVNLATLNERNRIARDIHDHVGHVISSSLIQLGALSVATKDDAQREGLRRIKDALAKGLDSIRESIHNLHDDSVDLHHEIYYLLRDFTFCLVEFRDDVTSKPDIKIAYCIIAVLKEALANIMRHSNATKVRITLLEHPALYQLVIADNGTPASKGVALDPLGGSGIGLRNIIDRVRRLNGHVQIRAEQGFEIFVSVPKGGAS